MNHKTLLILCHNHLVKTHRAFVARVESEGVENPSPQLTKTGKDYQDAQLLFGSIARMMDGKLPKHPDYQTVRDKLDGAHDSFMMEVNTNPSFASQTTNENPIALTYQNALIAYAILLAGNVGDAVFRTDLLAKECPPSLQAHAQALMGIGIAVETSGEVQS